MSDWMTPPRFLLLAVPVAMALSSWALQAGERRARARRQRDAMGGARARLDDAVDGEAVVLEGRIELAEGPCERFEDGAPVAAATVESAGIRAVRGEMRWRADFEQLPRVAHSARAALVALTVGSERVILTGPVEVLVGSEETDPDAPFESLDARVRERVTAVAYPASLPSAKGSDPVHARPLFRSLRAGDRVRAAGVLGRHSDGERSGYRERARWALSGPVHRPVVLAYEGSPRHHGVIAAALRGVRRVAWLQAAAGLVVLTSALLALAFFGGRSGLKPAPTGPAPRAHAHPQLGAASECAALKQRHHAAVASMATCAADADCAVDTRGGVYFDLEGCYRYRNRRALPDEARGIEANWLDEGCATSYEICPAPPLALCLGGRCVERPPAKVPQTWRREDVPGGFFFFLPPETVRVPTGDDSAVTRYRGGGVDIVSDFGDAPDAPASEAESALIGAEAVRVWKVPGEILVHFENSQACAPPRCRYGESGETLTLHATCDSDAACQAAWVALQSTRFW